jgi:hypothetical protein
MGTKRSSVVVRHCVVIGTLALLLPGAIMSASAAPAVPHYTECQRTRAVAVYATYHQFGVNGASLQVWVTFDKLVDLNDSLYWCGKIRNHSQVRIAGNESGWMYGFLQDDSAQIWNSPTVWASGGTTDSWGQWVSVRCGTVWTGFFDGSNTYDSPQVYKCA